MNSLNFTGGLSRNAEIKYTAGGDAITSFGVALSSGYGDKKVTTWLNATIFGKRGEALAPYLLKGSQVAIVGEFTARPYTNKDGAEKLSLDVRVNDLTLIGGKPSGDMSVQEKKQSKLDTTMPDEFDDLEQIPF